MCRYVDTASSDAVSGAVRLTRNDNGAYAGTFELTLSSGDQVTGSFESTSCLGLHDYLTAAGNNQLTCG
jgi:hypothetical protein